MQLRYLQTLTEIGAEQNSTVVFPMPIDIVKPFLELLDKTGKPRGANAAIAPLTHAARQTAANGDWRTRELGRRSERGSGSVHDASVRENDLFRYIGSTHRGEVEIGSRSIHMHYQRELFFAIRRVPERDALAS